MQNLFEHEFKKRVLFVGMPDLALCCLSLLVEAKVNIVGVVPPCKTNSSHDILVNSAKSYGLRVIPFEKSLKDEKFLDEVRSLEADIAVVCSFDKLFPKEFLQTAKDGFLNVHPSLLPDYRGANPYSQIILNNDKVSGVTIHFMDETFDTGDIVHQLKFDVHKDETMGTLFNKANYISSQMLLEVLKYYEIEGELPRNKQPDGDFKKAPKIDPSLRNNFIDWDRPAVEIERFVRALNPFISAFTLYQGILMKIYTATVDKKTYKEPSGTIVETKNGLKIACKEGSLDIGVLQFGSYIITDAKDFEQRFKPAKGEMLTNG